MFSSLLIANRGEIARRIIRTASRLGIRTVAVYSAADATALFVAEADAAIAIGPAPAQESYLVPDKLLAAAHASGAEAIHPGYGFLAENAAFAEAVLAAGLGWVGPRPASIRAMGLKDAAKALMMKAGVPTTPGYLGEDQADTLLAAEAERVGYPLLIKAVAGGGGKGMRRVDRPEDFAAALASCRREAQAAFGDDRVLLEIYVSSPRHIEVQVFGDSHGNVVHLFERDCSLQRRHQKVIEEAPAPGMSDEVRAALCAAAVKAARAVDYEGAGTVEFIADASSGLRADKIWFMEMNTRLQVEHPVTEAVTGQDLVEWQLRVAAGEPLPLRQEQITLSGHAIEARLYAENPDTGFLPSTGRLEHFHLPSQSVRIDSAVQQGDEVTGFYDPMIAKLIAHAPRRAAAAQRLAEACAGVQIWPVKTNAAFLARTLRHEAFLNAALDTGFIETHLPALLGDAEPGEKVLQAAARARLAAHHTPLGLLGFRLNAAPRVELRLQCGGHRHNIALHPPLPPSSLPTANYGDETVVFDAGRAFAFGEVTADDTGQDTAMSDGAVHAPMPGHILSVAVAAGDTVQRGAPLLVMEAMKMEMTLNAPCDGIVDELNASPGARVAEGVLLLHLKSGA
ncbi:acetyl/propionyl/methylcrotonyl-CoA carboxylase subunit alpha [Acidocella sp.]|jgi:acetyl/propionyl-CoA carboxylase alpha subunit|uniref:acetyl/propionyl/methylcrotonyl-CoA carboxylase subunit alpha n=1 Tax=Acidocella sp. TaxID=50710 RepID=UPI002F423771